MKYTNKSPSSSISKDKKRDRSRSRSRSRKDGTRINDTQKENSETENFKVFTSSQNSLNLLEEELEDIQRERIDSKKLFLDIKNYYEGLDDIKNLKKEGIFSEDEVKSKEKSVQKVIEKYNEKIDEISQNKETEVMEV